MMIVVGTRVIAVASINDTEIAVYGYGTFEGEAVMDNPGLRKQYLEASYRALPELTEERRKAVIDEMMMTRTIRLDDGTVIYGNQCWICEATKLFRLKGTRSIVRVPLEDRLLAPYPLTATA